MKNHSQVDPGIGPRLGGAFWVVSVGVAFSSLDLFIVNVALPDIAVDMKSSDPSALSWVLNAYAITFASLLVFFGRMADRFRADRAYLVGVGVFTVASVGCAFAPNVLGLVAFRVLQAAGAALLTPTSLSVLLASTDPVRRPSAVRAWTAVGGVAASLGPVVGGVLVAIDWRLIFLVNVPVGLVAIGAGLKILPAVPGHRTEAPGGRGVVLLTFGIASMTLALVKGSEWGWLSVRVLAAAVVAVALLTGFVVHTRSSRSPLVHPELFASRAFVGACVIAVLFSAALGSMLYSLTLWDQQQWRWSALRAGLSIAPGPLMVPLFSFLIDGPLIDRIGRRAVSALGSAAFGGGMVWWAVAIQATPNYWVGAFGGLVLTGVGVGLTLPTMMMVAAGSLPSHAFATGSGVVNMFRQTGLALGVAITVAVLGRYAPAHAAALPHFRAAWWISAGISVLGALPALLLLGEHHRLARTPAAVLPADATGRQA